MNYEGMHPWHRTEVLVGKLGLEKLKNASVMVIGVGGVGSYALEALARAGVGKIHLVDFDKICITNVNRQLHAMKGTYGKVKVEVMAERLRLIHPSIEIIPHQRFYSKDSSDELLSLKPDFILDCIDNVTAKTHLLQVCYERKIPLLVTLGTANKISPFGIQLADLHETLKCPLGKILRANARDLGIKRGVPCLFSPEDQRERDKEANDKFKCVCPQKDPRHNCDNRAAINGTISYVPAIFGLTGAGLIIQSILDDIKIFNYCYPQEAKVSLKEISSQYIH